MLFEILVLISTLTVISLLKRLVNIFPTLVACMLRWKESINLEGSVKNSYDRDILAVSMVIPFCLTADKFRLYDPVFMEGMGENLHLGVTFGVFLTYCLVRILASMMVHTRKIEKKKFDVAGKISYTFFIILTLTLTTVGGILSFLHVNAEVIRSAMLWISAFIYTLLLLRKTQIFSSGCSIFASFLYLCALEILPTGLLIASALIF